MDLKTALHLHQKGRLAKAEVAYRNLLAVSPANHGAPHGLGVLRYRAGDSTEAAALLRQAVNIGPPAPEYAFNLGLALQRIGQNDEAVVAFTEAVRRHPLWPEPHYDLGRALKAAGQPEAAMRAFRTALKLRPNFFQAEVNLANTLRGLGKLDQASAAYRRVLRHRPDLAEVHHGLAVVLLAQRDATGAETSLRAAIGLRADFASSYEALARLLIASQRFSEALPFAARAHHLMPHRADVAELLGQAQMGAGHPRAALSSYHLALAMEPGRPSVRFGMAEVLRAVRDFAAAEAMLRELVAERPETWLAHHDHGNALRDLGRFAEAEAAYPGALAIVETPLHLIISPPCCVISVAWRRRRLPPSAA